jgi:hypothetical protein
LISSFPGNHPLRWFEIGFPGCIHCETYPEIDTNKTPYPPFLERDNITPYIRKPDDKQFYVNNRYEIIMQKGDHIKVIGRWVIDHHPEYCNGGRDKNLSHKCRDRGFLRVGPVHTELHPIRWKEIEIVTDISPTETNVERLSLAAPLYEEQYLGGWKWVANEFAGVAGKVFISDDGSNFHNSVSATLHIKTPPLPPNFNPHSSLVNYKEVYVRGRQPINHSITVVNDGIKVKVELVAPIKDHIDGIDVADIHDPANDRSVYQRDYYVSWKPRLVAIDPTNDNASVDSVQIPPVKVGSVKSTTTILIRNRGPDELNVKTIKLTNDSSSSIKLIGHPQMPAKLAGSITDIYALDVTVEFDPQTIGEYTANLWIESNDPAHSIVLIPIIAKAVNENPECIKIYSDITALNSEIKELQAELKDAVGSHKAVLAQRIRALQSKIKILKNRAENLNCNPR